MHFGNIGMRFNSNKQGAPTFRGWARLARIGIALVALALLSLGSVALAQEVVDVQLDPVGDSGVSGTARLVAAGEATEVTLDVTGLDPDAQAVVTMHAGTCDLPGASFATLPDLTADASGAATATGTVLFRGSEDVALATMADGEHVISISAGDQVVACGVIPQLISAQGTAGDAPTELPETGGAGLPIAAVVVSILGLGALGTGLFLKQRGQSRLS
ncbi:MAG TPA: hypothetical protein VLC52_00205 [Anaerolineae bacterium]|nr:hypothetical protein [Anaerolineae bacterium]